MISQVGIDLFRSGCAASEVELDLKKTQRRGDLGARRAPDEAQERPSLASGTAPEGVLEVRSARVVKLCRSSRRGAKLEALEPPPGTPKKALVFEA